MCIRDSGVHAPETANEEESDLLYDEFQKQLDMYNNKNYLVIASDVKMRVDNQVIDHFGENRIYKKLNKTARIC